MKQILEEYGTFLLEGMVLVSILGLLFGRITDEAGNKGMYAMIGAKIKTQDFAYGGYTDFKETVSKECKKTAPKIHYYGGSLQTGIVRLSEVIYATDYAGRNLQIKIKEIHTPLGESGMETFLPDTMELVMEEPGIYTVCVLAKDDGNRTSECIIRIPVNKNGEAN